MSDPNILEKVNLDNTEYLLKDSATGTLTANDISTGTDTSGKFISASVLKSVLYSGELLQMLKLMVFLFLIVRVWLIFQKM